MIPISRLLIQKDDNFIFINVINNIVGFINVICTRNRIYIILEDIKRLIMKIFAIICLAIILIAIQHLLNWLWRKTIDEYDDEVIIAMIILSIVALTLTIFGGKILAGWIVSL